MQRTPTNTDHELLPEHIEMVDPDMAKRFAAMTPEQRLRLAFQTMKSAREFVLRALRAQYPEASPEDIHAMHRRRMGLGK